jgi:hypothetical protein
MLMGFYSRKLAYVLDSLVRVSRRVSRSHFDKISIKEALRHCDALELKWVERQALHTTTSPSSACNTSFCLLSAINLDGECVNHVAYEELNTTKYPTTNNIVTLREFLLLLPFQRFQIF